MKSNSLKSENFWISILWSVVFLVVLAWDQEKIVVLNLVLFCYSLYYISSDAIVATVIQRRNALTEALLSELTSRLDLFGAWVEVTKLNLIHYNTLALTILKRFNVVALRLSQSFELDNVNGRVSIQNYSHVFYLLNCFLNSAWSEQLFLHIQNNFFITNQLLLDNAFLQGFGVSDNPTPNTTEN